MKGEPFITPDKIFAYLQLMRFPNLFTSMADIVAGYLIIKGLHMEWTELVALCLSTSFIYGGGCILNDVRDRNRDARERPFRPIPSGRVALWEARLLTCFFFGLGLFTAFLAGRMSLVMALLLILLAVSYNLLTKEMPVAGPVNMAACRGVNLLLGMSPAFSLAGIAFVFPVITFIYVFSLTTLSHFEVEGGLRGKGWVVFGSLLLVVVSLTMLAMTKYFALNGLIYLGLLVLFAGPPLLAGLLKPAPDRIGRAVKFLILGIPLLDAVYVSGLHGWAFGIPVAFCAVPSMVLSRYLYVT